MGQATLPHNLRKVLIAKEWGLTYDQIQSNPTWWNDACWFYLQNLAAETERRNAK